MDLTFYKLHSTGGDYVLSSFIHGPAPDLSIFPRVAKSICKRRTGIGANGLLVLCRGSEHPFSLHFFPAHGDNGSIPADALVCVGRYAFDSGLANNNRISGESDFGAVTIEAIDSGNFRVDLGVPAHPDTGDEIHLSADVDLMDTVKVGGRRIPYSPINLHDNYAVVITDKRPQSIRLLAISMSHHEDLAGFQPVFLRSIKSDECTGYSWAANRTPDHARSMAACAAVGILNGICDDEVAINFRSHMLFVQWRQREGRLYVTAPAEYICSGSYYFDDNESQ